MRKLVAALAAVAVMAATGSALAIPTMSLTLQEGALTTTITSTTGSIDLADYVFGDFKLNVLSGISSLPDNPGVNSLFLTSVSAKNQNASLTKTLTVTLSGTD